MASHYCFDDFIPSTIKKKIVLQHHNSTYKNWPKSTRHELWALSLRIVSRWKNWQINQIGIKIQKMDEKKNV
jgi:hypothetical protein